MLGEGPAALGEHVAVHGVEDGLVARERPVEVEGDSADDAHPRASVPLPAAELRHAPPVILAIDQGTTGTTCLVVDDELQAVGRGYREIEQHFPRAGLGRARRRGDLGERPRGGRARPSRRPRVAAHDLAAIGITNQRETTVVWDPASGRPAPAGDRLAGPPHRRPLPDASARADPRRAPGSCPTRTSRRRRSSGSWSARIGRRRELAFGTVDSWLVWKLTGGPRTSPTSRTPRGRCSSTSDRLDWDDELLALFGVDRELLPEIVPVERCRRRGGAARRDAFRSRASPATSRRRSSGRAASSPERPRPHTAPAASCSSTSASDADAAARGSPADGCGGRARATRRSSRSRARSSSRAPRSSGCATGSGSSSSAGETEALATERRLDAKA